MDAGHTAIRRGTFFFLAVAVSGDGERAEATGGSDAEGDAARGVDGTAQGDDTDLIDGEGLKVQSRFLASPYYQKARTVALYAPIRGEVPTRDILIAALQDEKIVCYPLSHVHGRILSFRAIKSEAELEPGRLGVREPTNASELDRGGSDRSVRGAGPGLHADGKRLGRGGGYYDATLKAASARSRRVGLAFSEQIVGSSFRPRTMTWTWTSSSPSRRCCAACTATGTSWTRRGGRPRDGEGHDAHFPGPSWR